MSNSTIHSIFKWCNTKSMTIEESDFRLTSVTDYSNLFDLEILTTINKGKSNERTEFKNVAYGVSLEYALKAVARFRIANKHNKVNLTQYITELKSELKKLREKLDVESN